MHTIRRVIYKADKWLVKLNRLDKYVIGAFRHGKGAESGGHHEQIIWAANQQSSKPKWLWAFALNCCDREVMSCVATPKASMLGWWTT